MNGFIAYTVYNTLTGRIRCCCYSTDNSSEPPGLNPDEDILTVLSDPDKQYVNEDGQVTDMFLFEPEVKAGVVRNLPEGTIAYFEDQNLTEVGGEIDVGENWPTAGLVTFMCFRYKTMVLEFTPRD